MGWLGACGGSRHVPHCPDTSPPKPTGGDELETGSCPLPIPPAPPRPHGDPPQALHPDAQSPARNRASAPLSWLPAPRLAPPAGSVLSTAAAAGNVGARSVVLPPLSEVRESCPVSCPAHGR